MVYTQFIVVERCRGCGVCESSAAANNTNWAFIDLAAQRFAEDVKQLRGELAAIAKVQAQMEVLLKSTHGDNSQATADLEHVAARANEVSLALEPATPENDAENASSDGECTKKPLADVKHRCHGNESADCETGAAGKKSRKKKKKAMPETKLLDDVRRRCEEVEGFDGETVAAKTRFDKSKPEKPFDSDAGDDNLLMADKPSGASKQERAAETALRRLRLAETAQIETAKEIFDTEQKLEKLRDFIVEQGKTILVCRNEASFQCPRAAATSSTCSSTTT